MKTVTCKDLGADCDFVAKGNTAEEALRQMGNHAMKAHADIVAEMKKTMSQTEIMNKIMSKMKDA